MIRRRLMDEWRDGLLIELRARGIPGRQIGEILAEIDAHCTDSGQDPAEAFGAPASYAAEAASALPGPGPRRKAPDVGLRAALRDGLMVTATLAGILGLLSGANAVGHGIRGTITVGELAAAAVPGAVAAVILGIGPHRMPGLSARGGIALLLILGVAAATYPQSLLTQVVCHVPGWIMLGTGLALFTAAQIWAGFRRTGQQVIDPRTGTLPFAVPRWLVPAGLWLPLILAVGIVIVVVASALS
jgi:hypothetical protein